MEITLGPPCRGTSCAPEQEEGPQCRDCCVELFRDTLTSTVALLIALKDANIYFKLLIHLAVDCGNCFVISWALSTGGTSSRMQDQQLRARSSPVLLGEAALLEGSQFQCSDLSHTLIWCSRDGWGRNVWAVPLSFTRVQPIVNFSVQKTDCLKKKKALVEGETQIVHGRKICWELLYRQKPHLAWESHSWNGAGMRYWVGCCHLLLRTLKNQQVTLNVNQPLALQCWVSVSL